MSAENLLEDPHSTKTSEVPSAIFSEVSAANYTTNTSGARIEDNADRFLPKVTTSTDTGSGTDYRVATLTASPAKGNDLPPEFGAGNLFISDSSLEGFEYRSPDELKRDEAAQPIPEGQANRLFTVDAPTDGQLKAELFNSKVPLEVQGTLSVFLTDLASGNTDAIASLLKNGLSPEERLAFMDSANQILERRGIKLSFGGAPNKPNTDEIVIQRTTVGATNGEKPFSKTEALSISLKDGSVKAFKATTDETGEIKNQEDLKPADVANGMKRWLGLVARSDTAAKIFQDAAFGFDDSNKTLGTLMQSAYAEFGEVGCLQLAENLKYAAALDRRINGKTVGVLQKDSLSVQFSGGDAELRFGGKGSSFVVKVPVKR